MNYQGKWIDCFQFEKYAGNERPQCKGKIVFKTPCIDYYLTKTQFEELKKKIEAVEL